ncbi:MAG: aromatic ring-hydroxylating dioxygenase subunit alpha [Candidatus Competibacterales bacterium]
MSDVLNAVLATSDALDRPINYAEGLPGIAYGPEAYEIERQQLFPRRWVVCGFDHEVKNPGDVMPLNIAGWPVVLVRGQDGVLRGFHNVCRHRGMQVVLEPGRGLKTLVCPWHCWAYGLDGGLVRSVDLGGEKVHRAEGFDPHGLGLVPVATATWFDLVFVNLDGNAPPLEQHLAPLTELLGGVALDQFQPAGTVAEPHIYQGNWKLSVEGAIEDYHLPFVHRQIVKPGDARAESYAAELGGDCYAGFRMVHAPGGNRALAPDPRGLPGDPSLLQDGRTTSFLLNLFPSGFITVAANHVTAGWLLPDGFDRTVIRLSYYFYGAGATDPDLAHKRQGVMDSWNTVMPQDAFLVKGVHHTAEARQRFGIETRFSPAWEAAVLHFQRQVRDAYREA